MKSEYTDNFLIFLYLLKGFMKPVNVYQFDLIATFQYASIIA